MPEIEAMKLENDANSCANARRERLPWARPKLVTLISRVDEIGLNVAANPDTAGFAGSS
jgi:hypothetical protein